MGKTLAASLADGALRARPVSSKEVAYQRAVQTARYIQAHAEGVSGAQEVLLYWMDRRSIPRPGTLTRSSSRRRSQEMRNTIAR